VEVEGEHKPKRFSTWAPKAIATIRSLADTLEDRAIVVQLQRKARSAKVERLRKRDSKEFATLRRKAARWAEDYFLELTDPDPNIPEALNDRAADNWRPLLAIADLAGDDWPSRARDAACALSGEGHDAPSISVELLTDCHRAFRDDDAVRSVDLCRELASDPERPWVEWRNGKPITPKQLGYLLRPFNIISETVRIPGLDDAKGYLRSRFEDAWERYLPGQTPSPTDSSLPKRPNVLMPMPSAQHDDFQNVQEATPDVSENSNLSYSRSGLDGWTFPESPDGSEGDSANFEEASDDASFGDVEATAIDPESISIDPPTDPEPARAEVETANADDTGDIPACLRRCVQCGAPSDATGTVALREVHGKFKWLHPQCADFQKQHPELCK
jgi:hypothetical protein